MHVYMYIDIYLCIYTYVPIYTFDFHYNQCASDQKDSNSQMFSSASATALRRFASVTAHIIFIHITSVEKPVHIFMARNRVSKSCLLGELCFLYILLKGFLVSYILQPYFSWKLSIKILRMDLSQLFNMQSMSHYLHEPLLETCNSCCLYPTGLSIRKKPFIEFESDDLIYLKVGNFHVLKQHDKVT